MKYPIVWLIFIIFLAIAPVVPYERSIDNGTTVIEQKSVAMYLYDKYQEVNKDKP